MTQLLKPFSLKPNMASNFAGTKRFVPAKLDAILGLREKGLRSCVILTLGYRQADKDWLVNLKKVRKSKADLITEIA